MRLLYMTLWWLAIPHISFAQTFTLKSKDLQGQFTEAYLANVFGCQGENTSPELQWSNPPVGTQSYAITMFDADAPTGSGWWHWVVFDIPALTTALPRNAGKLTEHLLPAGSVQSLTDFGVAGYGGPCPPAGDKPHGYIITLYALNTAKLGQQQTATPALVAFLLRTHVIAKASLLVYSKR
jgi:Raf kinase inhibitor-like YbhB/YbcL family protein